MIIAMFEEGLAFTNHHPLLLAMGYTDLGANRRVPNPRDHAAMP